MAETLLAVVSEKTGYPVEMLELEMGMDSDLGIDSIKRVEILSALQERLPGAPVIGPEHLGTLHTLGEIAAHLARRQRSPPASAAADRRQRRQPPLPAPIVTETLLAVVSEKTGYPVEMLELEMGMDSDLGIDSIKRVEILSALQERLPGAPVIGPEHLGTLHTLGEIAAHLGAGAATSRHAASGNRSRAAIASASADTVVTETLLAVVSEKTGYPVEMLEAGDGAWIPTSASTPSSGSRSSPPSRNGSPARPSSARSTSARCAPWARSPATSGPALATARLSHRRPVQRTCGHRRHPAAAAGRTRQSASEAPSSRSRSTTMPLQALYRWPTTASSG